MVPRLGVNPSSPTLESKFSARIEITQHSSDLPKTNWQPFTHPCKDVTTDTVALPLSSPLWQHRRTLTYEFSISAELKNVLQRTVRPRFVVKMKTRHNPHERRWRWRHTATALSHCSAFLCALYATYLMVQDRRRDVCFCFFFLFSHSAPLQICCIFYRCSPEALVLEQTDNSCCHRGVTHLPRLARYCWLRAAFS